MLWVGLVVGVCGWAVWRAQRRWMRLPGPAATLLGWSVVTLTVLTTIAQLLGAIGLLRGWGVIAAVAPVGVAGWVIGRGTDPDPAPSLPAERDGSNRRAVMRDFSAATGVDLSAWPGRLEVSMLAAAFAAVGAQWGAHVGDAFARGMVQADNLWYHGPFVARIAQTGGLGSLAPFGYPESRYFPLNTHVLGAMLTLPTGSDVFIPVLNHLFAALALLAAWVIGCRRGAAIPAVLAALAVLSLPLVVSTQPGQMYNDVAALALVLGAVALFSVSDRLATGTPERLTSAVTAFLALGWALSTKLTVVAPLAVVAIGMAVVLVRRGERAAAFAGSVAFVLTGGIWFVRNLVVSGSPMPYADLAVGPVGFERRVPTTGTTLFSTLDDLGEHGRYYLESLDWSFGPLWFLVVAGAVAGSVAGLVQFASTLRVAALGALAGIVGFPLMPLTGGLPFVNNLRYVLAALVLGAVVGAVAAGGRTWSRWSVLVAAAAVVVADLVSPHRARVPAWPDERWWAVGGAAVAAALVTAPWWWDALVRLGSPRSRLVVGGVMVAGAVATLVIALPTLEDRYFDARYAGGDLPDAALYAAAAAEDPIRIDVFASDESYPFFGPRLDHHVELWNDRLGEIPGGDAGCATVRGWLSDPLDAEIGRIVVGQAWLTRSFTEAERAAWFATDPAVVVVYDDGEEAVYERIGPLDPTACLGE